MGHDACVGAVWHDKVRSEPASWMRRLGTSAVVNFPGHPGASFGGVPRDSGDRERVRDASDIVRIVGEHVALKPKGREYVGLCPFHDDHNPSMRVVPTKGIFHCFVCGTGGDVFSFVQKIHNMEFREALQYLAERAGVALTPWRASGGGESGPTRSELLQAMSAACEYFQETLSDAVAGLAGREVIERRGIAPAMVEAFRLGVAPAGWEGLVTALRRRGHSEATLVEAGLVKRRERGEGTYDLLRNRLIFPISDQIGRVIAFGGRKIDEADEPKYLNSPETRLFNKSATLYGLSQAARSVQARRTVIITEGYTDAIACHQGGFTNAVATLGTALTREHAVVLRRLCDRVVLLFDGDDAGQRAADRAFPIFFGEPLDVSIVTLNAYTDAKDPDELLKRSGGGEVFQTALNGAVDLLEFRFARLRKRMEGAGVAALSRAIDEEIEQIVDWGLHEVTPVRQALIVRRLAEVAGVSEDAIRRAIPAGRSGPRSRASGFAGGASGGPASGASESTESGENVASVDPAVELSALMNHLQSTGLGPREHLLGCVLARGVLWLSLSEAERAAVAPEAYAFGLLTRIAQVVCDIGLRGDPPDLAALLSEVDELSVKQAAVALHERVQTDTQGSEERLDRHWKECLRRLQLDGQSPAGAIDPAAGAGLVARIELKRKAREVLGANLKVLPRPR